MAFPVSGSPSLGAANPNPAYSGTFIPSIWSGKLLEKFYDKTVLGAISNTDYEGEIKSHGDRVIIRTKPTLTIRDYQANQTLTVERPSSNVVELLIDKGKYFYAALDDVMRIQSDIDQLSLWAEDAGQQLKIKVDTDVLAYIATALNPDNSGAAAGRVSGNINLGAAGAPVVVVPRSPGSGETVAEHLVVDLGQALDEQNIPEDGRWLVAPSWFISTMKKGEVSFANQMGDDTSVLRHGRIGTIDRFTIYQSHQLPTAVEGSDTASYIYAGHKNGLTFASQLEKMQTLQAESTFSTLQRGLMVYGRKVLDDTAIAAAYVVRG